jgi:hypothetical protein
VAERSGDTAFVCGKANKMSATLALQKSGVALHFPPQSKLCSSPPVSESHKKKP